MGLYDRMAAVRYAARWWDGYNPAYPALPDDCTSFASQVLHAGGLPQVPEAARTGGWWFRHKREGWSFSWAVAHALHGFLLASGRAEARPEAPGLLPGDLILYDWDGRGRWRHAVAVVGLDGRRKPLVAAHTHARWAHPWPYTDSPAYTPACRYAFLHIRQD